MRSSRLTVILAAVGVGVLFLAGLLVHGPVGGILLAAVAAILVAISSASWAGLPPRGRFARGAVIALVAALAVVKLADRA